MRLPHVATFADPTLAEGPSGAVHDAAWLIETRLAQVPITVVLDATVPVFVQHRTAMVALARSLPRSRVIVIWTPGHDAGNAWIHGWPSHDLETVALSRAVADPLVEAIERANPAPIAAGHTVLLVAGRHALFTRAALEQLHAARPDLPLFTAIAAHSDDVDAPLRASGGGRLDLGGLPHSARPLLRLAIEPGPDVALTVHAARRSRAPDAVLDRPPLVEVDRVRLDAIAPHPDAAIFTVAATVRAPGATWSVTRFHVATRAAAIAPTVDQLDGVELRTSAPVPTCQPLEPQRHHPTAGGENLRRLRGTVSIDLDTATVTLDAELGYSDER